MFVLRPAALCAALACSPVPALAAEGFILNALGSTQTIYVLDNGEEVCRLQPGEGCTWAMSHGQHRVEVLNSRGASIFRDFSVPGSVPGLVVEDSAFRKPAPLAFEDLPNGSLP